MRLADEEITIRLDDEVIRLRPSLRAAQRLVIRYGGFAEIVREIADGNITVMADVIAHGAVYSSVADKWLEQLDRLPLRHCFDVLAEPLINFVKCLAGQGTDDAKQGISLERISFEEYHTRLFRIATGWLGWTPDQAWSATPAEITEAYEGRLELLKALFGRRDADNEEGTLDLTNPADRERIKAMGGLSRALMS